VPDHENPSDWIARFLPRIPVGGVVLDLACGAGRHVRLLRRHGHAVVAVDRDVTAVRAFGDPGIEVLEADLEGAPWPLGARTFASVVVTNYLWRPLAV
jgi:SAM-dependent methyltransferase